MSVLDLPPMPDDAAPVVLPGLLAALGVTRRQPDPDFTASIDAGLLESYEDYCARISKQEA